MENPHPYWSESPETVLKSLGTQKEGLSAAEAMARYKPDPPRRKAWLRALVLFASQFKSPVTLLLVFALSLSSAMGEYREAVIILIILVISAILSFIQEYRANRAAEKLGAMLKARADVIRAGKSLDILAEEVVPGDIVLLQAGDLVPADSLILDSEDLYVNESVLTGESYPAEKKPGILPADTPLASRKNCVFNGTSVISGIATVVSVKTGADSEIGIIENELTRAKQATAFEKGINQFGYMLMRVALVIALIIMIINVLSGRETVDSILFALALSVGLAPEMLPAIVTITLSFGAARMARKKVIVKKLSSIQNLGSIDILCADKTGTLTEGEVLIHSYVSPSGEPSEKVRLYGYLNACFESGYPNPMDIAIRKEVPGGTESYRKLDEVPYDFIRKRLSIVVDHPSGHIMITKGALKNIAEVCHQVEISPGRIEPMVLHREQILERFSHFSREGFRTIGVCCKDVTDDPVITKDDECDMTFLGFILLYDPPRAEAKKMIQELKQKGVRLKIITGDNALIAEKMASELGISSTSILSGKDLNSMNDEALSATLHRIHIFAETEPLHKERIVQVLQKKGHVVGYIGDGVNDASALRMADVGISVHNAVDVAKEAADMILTEKNLDVISGGITEGRKTYLNTLKYIFITISANFGNMFSMGIGSLLLPFFPLLPSQILLTNFLSDIPALSISSDLIDEEMLLKSQKWNTRLLRNFMIVFGLFSSLFDFITFGVLYWYFKTDSETFRTGWFIESVLTEIAILLVIRTHKNFLSSKIGKPVWISSLVVALCVLSIPYLPFMSTLGFTPLSPEIMIAILTIALLYMILAEITKRILFSKMGYR